MPRQDGTGPTGKGPRGQTPRNRRQNIGLTQISFQNAGTGPCAGSGARGRTDARSCSQPGECICPQCGTKAPHTPGVPCLQTKCPQCGMTMVRA